MIKEEAYFVASTEGPLFAVLATPDSPGDRAMVLAGGGWTGSSSNRNSVLVRMAREVADTGLGTVRFDWHGTGESGGTLDRFRLDQPFVDDVIAVAGSVPATTLALAGICFGALSVLGAAVALPEVDHVVLISLPFPSPITKTDHKLDRLTLDTAMRMVTRPAVLRQVVTNRDLRTAAVAGVKRKMGLARSRPLTLPARSVTDLGVSTITALLERGTRVDLVFGEQDLEYSTYLDYTAHTPLPPEVAVSIIPGDVSNFSTLEAQRRTIDTVLGLVNRAR